METGLAGLTLNENEEAVLQIQDEFIPNGEEEVFRLVGCFLTASIIHFPAMKSTMANLWHPVRGVQIPNLGNRRYLFQFYHVMDMERVLKGAPWTFNNHLLMLHVVQWGEDPLQVPLFLTPFWVQIHDVPIGLFSESLVVQLGNFVGSFFEYDASNLGKENKNYMRFKYERLSLFCFYCGRLGHSDSYCEGKMALGVEVAELGWDLSLRAQSRRALSMNSVWLREEGEGRMKGNKDGNYTEENVAWIARHK
ncbi:hypothetical protein PVK06_010987 [Gossypium arboreum]|uniref:CCHC-type domain-containing protein n=1 Tax=Gossypium arboreum TaxID=29729 RepID=A0ABR0Q7K9_GOSAR|nr:hypothetical protein PVK06_010987 [Gossypium arboreum]